MYMYDKITVVGEYTGNDPKGTMIGGKVFLPGFVVEAQVSEETFKALQIAQENGWFKMNSNNYHLYLGERGVAINIDTLDGKDLVPFALAENKETEEVKTEVVEEVKTEVTEEVKTEVTEEVKTEVTEEVKVKNPRKKKAE